MTAGIEIYNNNNILQITNQYRNLQFLGKGTIQCTQLGMSSSQWASNDIILTNTSEFLCFRPETNDVPVLLYGRTFLRNGVLNSRIAVANNASYPHLTNPITVTYYRFSLAPAVQKGNHFEVYDSAGELVFSDGASFMKVIASCKGVEDRDVLWSDKPPGYTDASSLWYGHKGFEIHSTDIPVGKKVAVLSGIGLYETWLEEGFDPGIEIGAGGWGLGGGGTGDYIVGKETSSGWVFRESQVEFWKFEINGGSDIGNPVQRETGYNYLLIDVTDL